MRNKNSRPDISTSTTYEITLTTILKQVFLWNKKWGSVYSHYCTDKNLEENHISIKTNLNSYRWNNAYELLSNFLSLKYCILEIYFQQNTFFYWKPETANEVVLKKSILKNMEAATRATMEKGCS